MRMILIWAAALAVGALAWGQQPASSTPKKSAPARKAPASTVAHKAPAKSAAKKAAPKTTWRNRQATPTPDRYREIHNALASKGYLTQEAAAGPWGQGSVDALKRFQTEQNLDPSGKINSLSLIALGLGPKYDTSNRALDVNPGQSDRQ